ncbi:adenylylsulfate kinase (plasmid) [Nitratidesulfovibrio vulgaris str. Hildenborough]|uniref:Adenylyl-sulfate kinase n=1 Tax=Nitratidesulfovibrio vulgaris (strain ATCC 29579 / DSM 644 / CCUG 34227 / NCIMB 8303 / VKM B-1760 / Hildenborough) TaxID=882 RepID=Q72WL0_NITV2|nr:adenylylsulfate kinase [Nitratidesulfovibrio vulgaris str. Hildenborough]
MPCYPTYPTDGQDMKSCNTFFCDGRIRRPDRERLNGHPARAFWFTGLPSAGKSTLAHIAEEVLHQRGIRTYVFDGDNVRHGLCGDLGFSEHDRKENVRRIAETVRLFLDAGILCLCAFVSPLRANRQAVRDIIGPCDFFEVYVKCPVTVCESRDVKGLYGKARQGLVENYTGISAPYEEPESPDIVVDTSRNTIEESVQSLTDFILQVMTVPCAQKDAQAPGKAVRFP